MLQVGRAGRFGTKGLAITFVSSPSDSEVLNQVMHSCCFSWHGGVEMVRTYHGRRVEILVAAASALGA